LQEMLNLESTYLPGQITKNSFDELVERMTVSRPNKNLEKLTHPGEKLLRISDPKEKLLKCTKKQSRAATDTEGCVYYFTDITQEFQLDTLKSNFLATAAHELRTPLTTIMGFSELMSTQNLPPDVRKELITSIFRHSLQLNSLLSDLLDLSKIESEGANVFKPQCIDLAVLLHDLVMKSSIQEENNRFIQGHRISLKTDAGASYMIVADEEKLLRVFQNLLSNATKYSAPDSPIVITAHHDQRNEKPSIKVSVIDQGIGMTPEEAEHAFHRFWRADSSSGKIPGTGLGLPLVKEIVDLHQGQVELDSKYGIGTSVSIYLPVDMPA
jgi:signal transduction histidine kinase